MAEIRQPSGVRMANGNLLARICVLFSTDRRAQEGAALLTLEELVEQPSR
jgi:hypothetical protein